MGEHPSSEQISVALAATLAKQVADLVAARWSEEQSGHQLEDAAILRGVFDRVGETRQDIARLSATVEGVLSAVSVQGERITTVEARLSGLEKSSEAARAETIEHRKRCDQIFCQHADQINGLLSQVHGACETVTSGEWQTNQLRTELDRLEQIGVEQTKARRDWVRWAIMASIALLGLLVGRLDFCSQLDPRPAASAQHIRLDAAVKR